MNLCSAETSAPGTSQAGGSEVRRSERAPTEASRKPLLTDESDDDGPEITGGDGPAEATMHKIEEGIEGMLRIAGSSMLAAKTYQDIKDKLAQIYPAEVAGLSNSELVDTIKLVTDKLQAEGLSADPRAPEGIGLALPLATAVVASDGGAVVPSAGQYVGVTATAANNLWQSKVDAATEGGERSPQHPLPSPDYGAVDEGPAASPPIRPAKECQALTGGSNAPGGQPGKDKPTKCWNCHRGKHVQSNNDAARCRKRGHKGCAWKEDSREELYQTILKDTGDKEQAMREAQEMHDIAERARLARWTSTDEKHTQDLIQNIEHTAGSPTDPIQEVKALVADKVDRTPTHPPQDYAFCASCTAPFHQKRVRECVTVRDKQERRFCDWCLENQKEACEAMFHPASDPFGFMSMGGHNYPGEGGSSLCS